MHCNVRSMAFILCDWAWEKSALTAKSSEFINTSVSLQQSDSVYFSQESAIKIMECGCGRWTY